jgi:ribosomal protein L11 methyltransferase
MKYPALDVRGVDADLALAVVDDFAPTAVEDCADGVSIFFTSTARRDQAGVALEAAMPDARIASREVDDEDWARRSQQNLTPITVGRITVTPPWFADGVAPTSDLRPPSSDLQPLTSGPRPPTSDLQSPTSEPIVIVIEPSMGFGTGHHATTRLCLAALQTIDVVGRRVLDVGTGSGVLAIAAARLGALEAVGLDLDADAITSAQENLDANPDAAGVRFVVTDMRDASLPAADIVLANLTGAVLVQNAVHLSAAVRPGGTLIVSGLQTHERNDVEAAFSNAQLVWSAEEAGWVGLGFVTVAGDGRSATGDRLTGHL